VLGYVVVFMRVDTYIHAAQLMLMMCLLAYQLIWCWSCHVIPIYRLLLFSIYLYLIVQTVGRAKTWLEMECWIRISWARPTVGGSPVIGSDGPHHVPTAAEEFFNIFFKSFCKTIWPFQIFVDLATNRRWSQRPPRATAVWKVTTIAHGGKGAANGPLRAVGLMAAYRRGPRR
jgi:hypothetical protein